MIVTKTPLRVSFFGGGSDVEAYYSKRPGAVLSVTINSFVRIALQRVSPLHIKAMYSEVEQVTNPSFLKHDRIRECLRYFGIKSNLEIASFADIPTKGTGLGSSSTFTVGLIKALAAYTDTSLSRYELAEIASTIEIDGCGERIGKQDQYAAAFGGFNYMAFDADGIEVTPVHINPSTKSLLSNNLLCFFTGQTRSASTILDQQVTRLEQRDTDTLFYTGELAQLAGVSKDLLQKGKVQEFGELLDDAWKLKRSISTSISNPIIDQMYEDAIKAGALGGKLLGAGGGGYLLVYVPEKYQPAVIKKLRDFKPFVFDFTDDGSTVAFNDEESL
jgi:D-glycero-alpha-D-manno-heptose-7-phosphate kinase